MKFFAARDVVMQLQDNAHQYARYQGGITKYHLKRKLDRLRTLTVWYKFTMPQNVVNLSSKQLNFFEKSVLGLGLGFNLPPSRRDIIPTAASFDKFLFNHKSKISNQAYYVVPFLPFYWLSNAKLPISQKACKMPSQTYNEIRTRKS